MRAATKPKGRGAPASSPGESGKAKESSESDNAEQSTGANEFQGQDRRNYLDAKGVCSTFPPKKIASDLGIKADVSTGPGLVRLAEGFAAGYRPAFRQPVFEGCLDGLPNP